MPGNLSLYDLRAVAQQQLENVAEGAPLAPLTSALISLGVAASVTSLDTDRVRYAIEGALGSGASIGQVQETVALVSGLGVHSLMVSLPMIADRAREDGTLGDGPLDPARQALWDRYVGEDPYWASFETDVPGFLDAMLRLSPDQFTAFFTFCAVPWKSGTVRARDKELIALASDAAPTHRFLPGFKLHLRNALALGVGKRAILDTLDLAANAPSHRGTY